MDADGVEGHLGSHLGGVELRHTRLHIHPSTRIIGTSSVKDELTGRFELRRNHGELIAYRLMLPDRLAHRLPLLGVLHRIIELGLRNPERPGSDLDATDLQALHHLLESHALDLAEQLRLRVPKILENQLTRLNTLVSELRQ